MVNRRPAQTRARIEQTASRLRSLIHPEAVAPDELLVSERTGRIPYAEAQGLAFRPAEIGESFGPQWATYWFRLAATVPSSWAGRPVELVWDSGCEALLYRDGAPAQGLVEGGGYDRTTAPLGTPSGRVELELEMACNDLMGLPDPFPRRRDRTGRTWQEPTQDRSARAPRAPARLVRAGLALLDPEAWDMAWDFEALSQLVAEPGLDPSWEGRLLAELDRFARTWVAADRGTWPEARAILADLLAHRNAASAHEITAIGHAHIDTAWLWPLAETRRKIMRSWASQLALMDRYPEHRFAASSAQHYAWLERDAPGLYERLRERVREGRWEVVGGSWVEPDLNLPSGESLVRQLLYGQRDLQERFGTRCREFWTPDTFGYNGQLPQILRGAGIDRFLTQKLSWNQFTEPPHHSFVWAGIDGSDVLVHMPPADTYNAEVSIAELRASAARFKDHDRTAASLLVFGHGDGGGGPTAEMLEVARRAGDLQGVPRVELAPTSEFFDRLEEDLGRPRPITGELYFEYHRGTYTSQARTKRGNRACERLLGEAEAAAALAHRLGRAEYPAAELRELWQTVLTCQFHDILPGSSIREVYEDAERDHARVAARATELRDAAVAALGDDGPLNLSPFARDEVVEVDGALRAVHAPAYGVAAPAELAPVRRDGLTLANEHLTATLDEQGRLVSLVHDGREALAGPANVLELSDDRPVAYDAWEVEPYTDDTRRALPGAHAHRVLTETPERVELAFEHRIGERSSLTQTVRLDAGARRLELRTRIDWRERHALLQVAFPLAVRSARATYEMQFGVAERPTHANTQADAAQFEVPAHRFGDLSEHGFGVALLTPDTHGMSTQDSTMRISLLRAPTDPDPEADQGEHEIRYAVLPHRGSWQDAGVVAQARAFAEPLVPLAGGAAGAPRGGFAEVDEPALVLDSIKRAEGSDALILRLYEAHGSRGSARVSVGVPFSRACRTDLLEGEGDELPSRDGVIEVAYGPWELITIALRV
ncbi:MAG TPA: glycoside hydrolase family 38 C-terminal domain-containing protein [Solirubrobacteraceae bacterium]|nr:glycoside hydrolase family 38 C-terminal domain-containing protein [Solirubrobacteraceae bacterium]